MKIYLSNYWRQTGYLLLVSIIFIILGTIVFCIWSNDREDYIFVLCSAYFILVLTGIFLCSKRFLTYIIIDNKKLNRFHSFRENYVLYLPKGKFTTQFFQHLKGLTEQNLLRFPMNLLFIKKHSVLQK